MAGRILIVEDDKEISALLSDFLSRNGFETIVAKEGRAASLLLKQEEFELVLMDLMLPYVSGEQLIRDFREYSDKPVIVLSAKSMMETRLEMLRAGADDYITKPIDEEEMLLRIRALLRRAKIANEHKITIGDVVLDYDGLTVEGHGEQYVLPQKEFLLLYKLLSYPGKIFTRIQLMDEIWGAESETGWETVTVHVGRLRKRFEGWSEFEIESVRGLGYKAVKKI